MTFDCAGRGGAKYCTNPCAGCGKMDCAVKHFNKMNTCVMLADGLKQTAGAEVPGPSNESAVTSEDDAEGEEVKETEAEGEVFIDPALVAFLSIPGAS